MNRSPGRPTPILKNDFFFECREGDRDNLAFGCLSRDNVPSYHRPQRHDVIGWTSSANRGATANNDKNKNVPTDDKVESRYFENNPVSEFIFSSPSHYSYYETVFCL
jgi:hypothetical protein